MSVGTMSLHHYNLILNHTLSINFTFWSLVLSPSQAEPVLSLTHLLRLICAILDHLMVINGFIDQLINKLIKYGHVIAFLSMSYSI